VQVDVLAAAGLLRQCGAHLLLPKESLARAYLFLESLLPLHLLDLAGVDHEGVLLELAGLFALLSHPSGIPHVLLLDLALNVHLHLPPILEAGPVDGGDDVLPLVLVLLLEEVAQPEDHALLT